MTEEEQKYEKIANAIISYLDFIKDFKKKKEDYVITTEQNNIKQKYAFRNYNLDCFIIDKKYLDEFRKATNFDELTKILKDNTEENKNKFKEELTEYLNENPYRFDEEKIKLYSTEEELKGIVKNFNSYSFVNKEICEIMGVPEDMLNNNVVKISKNSVNTALLFSKNNFIVSINIDKNKKENIANENDEKNKNKIIETKDDKIEKKYKNLYYVEEITKQVFVLLYFNEQNIQNKLEKKIKDIYNFKKYYLINNKWLSEYKEYFLYDKISKIISDEFSNKNFTYKKIKYFLNDIIKSKIGQISLNQDTKISNFIRDAKNLKSKIIVNNVKIKNDKNNEQETLEPEEDENFSFPSNFNLIDEDIFNLLMKEEFFINVDDNLKETLSFNVLIGNNQIIINKKEEKFKYSHEYLFYSKKGEDNENQYDLQYILNFNKKEDFFNNLEKIINEGIGKYSSNLGVDLEQKESEVMIYDDKSNFIGKFVNFKLSEKNIKNYLDKNLFENNEEKDNIINENKIYELNDNKIKNKNKDNFMIVQNKSFEFNGKENKFEIYNNENIQFIAKINNNKEIKKKKEKEIEKDIEKQIDIEKEDMQLNENDNDNDKNINKIIMEEDHNKINEDNNPKKEDKEIIEEKNNINLDENEDNLNNIKQLRSEIDGIEEFYSLLFNIENDMGDLKINSLNPDEIIKRKNDNEIFEIILINQKFSEKFKSIIKYNLMKEYMDSKEEQQKNKLLKEHQKDFSEVSTIFNEEGILENLSLIINDYDLDKKIETKYLILNKSIFQNIYKKAEDIHIYLFLYQNKKYIFFQKERKIMEINKIENNIYTILNNVQNKKEIEIEKEILNEKDKEIILKYLSDIENQINKNYELVLNLNLDDNKNENYFEECYLINKGWLNHEKGQCQKIKGVDTKKPKPRYTKMSPKVKEDGKDLLNHPIDFSFISKKNGELIIKDLVSKYKDINIEDFCSAQIFFVNYQNNIPKEKMKFYPSQKYIGLKKENKIFFYLILKHTFEFAFLINYEKEEIINEEIQKKIMKKGIGSYIIENGVEFANNYYNIINYDLKEIGFCINFDKNKKLLYKTGRSKLLKDAKNSYTFNNVLQCLVNIKELKNFFFDQNQLIDLIDDDSIFSKYIYRIFYDMWNTNDEDNDNNEIYENLKKDIKRISESDNILNNAGLLIEFLLLRIHDEIKTDKDNNKMKDDITRLEKVYNNYNDMNSLFYPYNCSIIKDLFFFELQASYKCYSCKYNENQMFIKCFLELELDQKLNKLKNNEYITIYDLLDLKQTLKCIKCDYDCLYKRAINTCPKILILVIKLKEKNNIKFALEQEIDIIDYLQVKKQYLQTKYKLISSIINNSLTYYKSMEDNAWYKYEGINIKKINHINNKLDNIPYLLIYKQMPIKYYNRYT